MSAFIVSDRCMQRVVTAMHDHLNNSCEDADQLGRRLYAMNREALIARYGDDESIPLNNEWKWQLRIIELDHRGYPADQAEMCARLKALHCLIYQCSQGDVPKSALYQQLDEQTCLAERRLACSLPEYATAEWD